MCEIKINKDNLDENHFSFPYKVEEYKVQVKSADAEQLTFEKSSPSITKAPLLPEAKSSLL